MRKTCVSSTLTVTFDGQFWVGVIEHVEEGRYAVKRVVFGAEPSNQQVQQFVNAHWHKLDFKPSPETRDADPLKRCDRTVKRPNPKRISRAAAKELQRHGASARAQEALARERDAIKEQRRREMSVRKSQEAEARFELKQRKRKRKRRGR